MNSLLQCFNVGQTLSPAQPPAVASSSSSLWKGWALEGNTLVGPSFFVSEKHPSNLKWVDKKLLVKEFYSWLLKCCIINIITHPKWLHYYLTLLHRPASHTGSPCGRSGSWRARSAWPQWACRWRCAEAQRPGSGWHGPSRAAVAGTASAPWLPTGRWHKRSRPPCGKRFECGDSRAAQLTKPAEEKHTIQVQDSILLFFGYYILIYLYLLK